MENQAEYKDIEAASNGFAYLKKYAGSVINRKDENKDFIIETVTIWPYYLFNNGKREVTGFDIRLYVKDENFYIKSTDISTWIIR